MKAINPIDLSGSLGKLATGAGVGQLKRTAFTAAGGMLPITTIPLVAQGIKGISKGLNAVGKRMNPTGAIMHSGRHGFVNSHAIGLPLYMNSVRRIR